LAAVLFCIVMAMLLSLPLLGPFGMAVMAGVLVLMVVIGFHYLVWGWWLGPALRAEVEEQEPPETERKT
jgi:amino acid transporter